MSLGHAATMIPSLRQPLSIDILRLTTTSCSAMKTKKHVDIYIYVCYSQRLFPPKSHLIGTAPEKDHTPLTQLQASHADGRTKRDPTATHGTPRFQAATAVASSAGLRRYRCLEAAGFVPSRLMGT